ncbi:MAG TPA: S8 family serine peptidase [Reyranella sp.]|nr:S8 family serine peptidase [Reyranella sp.]
MPAQWSSVPTLYSKYLGIDPYVEWSLHLGPNFFFPPSKNDGGAGRELLQPPWPIPIPNFQFSRIAVLLRLKDISPYEFAQGRTLDGTPIFGEPLPTGVDWSDLVNVPPLYSHLGGPRNKHKDNIEYRYCTARVQIGFFALLAAPDRDVLRGHIWRLALGLPYAEEPLKTEAWSPPAEAEAFVPHPPAVVMGIIDDGLAVANRRFRDAAGGTRVRYVWVQDGNGPKPEPIIQPLSVGAPFAGLYGWQFDKGEIDAFMQQYTTDGAVDEDQLYRALGIIDYRLFPHQAAAQSIAHGTQVMDQAAGAEPGSADRTRPIVAVQLPTRTTATSSGADLSPHVAEAIDYILYCAGHLAHEYKVPNLPVVINFSYGRYAGPHDGTHLLEQLIDRRIAQREKYGKLRVVLPAGNNYLQRTHAKLRFGSASSLATTWRLQPDDLAPNYLEVWLPQAAAGSAMPLQRVSLTLTAPDGTASPALGEDPNNCLQLVDAEGRTLGGVIYAPASPQTHRAMFLVALAPTASHDGTGPAVSSGEWTVTLHNDAHHGLKPDDDVYAWIERNGPPLGYPPLGRQSSFDDPKYDYDIFYEPGGYEVDAPRPIEIDDPRSYVRRYGTLNAYATGEGSIVIGGYERWTRIVSHYSAAGPALKHGTYLREGPEALAPADSSDAHPGVLGTGTRSNSTVAMDGTSVAAPQVARLVADLLMRGRPADASEIKDLARQAEANPPPNLPNPPLPFGRERDGAGRLPLPPVVRRSDGKQGPPFAPPVPEAVDE